MLQKAQGPLGIWSKVLQEWLQEATKEVHPQLEAWNKFCVLILQVFTSGEVPQAFQWSTTAQILKGKGDFCGIGILEVAWKVCSHVINNCLEATILHPGLHGFGAHHGTDATFASSTMSAIPGFC